MARTTEVSPATKWISYATGVLPKVFGDRRPKAILLNVSGDVELKDADGTSITFKLPAGVAVPLRPKEIVSTTVAEVIALFD